VEQYLQKSHHVFLAFLHRPVQRSLLEDKDSKEDLNRQCAILSTKYSHVTYLS
jgi:hypothetical protein